MALQYKISFFAMTSLFEAQPKHFILFGAMQKHTDYTMFMVNKAESFQSMIFILSYYECIKIICAKKCRQLITILEPNSKFKLHDQDDHFT